MKTRTPHRTPSGTTSNVQKYKKLCTKSVFFSKKIIYVLYKASTLAKMITMMV